MTLAAPGLSLRRLGLTMASLALRCLDCRAAVTPDCNSYDRFFYSCGCGRRWSATLDAILPPGEG